MKKRRRGKKEKGSLLSASDPGGVSNCFSRFATLNV
jgi:hypothetical protein